jgi:hypothetical protein
VLACRQERTGHQMTSPAPKPASEPRRPATPDKIKRSAKAIVAADKAKPAISMRAALSDMQLLGSVLCGDSWRAWKILLVALMGERLEESERAVFRELTGRECEPGEAIEEFWGAIGRRGGKSRAMAVLAVYLAAFRDYRAVTVAGERPTVLLLAANVKQASISLSYVAGILESVPLLSQMVKGRTADSVELINGVVIEVRPASFKGLRGITAVAVVADEIAFWHTEDSQSSNPDSEIIAALRPSLATTQGPLICISSPYARRGELWTTYQRHFGAKGDPKILVAKAPSRTMNPSLPQRVVDRAMERDAASASAEYMAEFRTDLERFVSLEAVQDCVPPGVRELPPQRQAYVCFIDPSGGSADSMTMAIAYRNHDGGAVLVAIRERRPPFSPAAVVAEFAEILRLYGVREVRGDAYGAVWVQEAFEKLGIGYRHSEKNRSQLYSELLPALNSREVTLLDDKRLVAQLVGLERRTSRSGKDSIDHAPGGHDDVANACAGALVYAVGRRRPELFWG